MEKIYKNASWDAKKIMNGFKHLLIVCFLFVTGNVWGQTTLISPTGDGGFENGTTFAANGWTVVSGATPTNNIFVIGGSTQLGYTPNGTNGVFVSNNGTTRGYGHTLAITWIYRDITFPAGETKISFSMDLFGNTGDLGFDGIIVGHSANTFTASLTTGASGSMSSTSITGMTIATTSTSNGFIEDGNYTSATNRTFTIVGIGNQSTSVTRRIWIGFRCDGSVGNTTTPYSFDRVSLTSAVPATYTWIATTGTAAWATAASWSPSRTTPDASDNLNFSNGGNSIVTIPSTGAIGGNVTFSNNTTARFQASTSTATTLTLGGLTIPSGSTLLSDGSTGNLTLAFSSGAVNSINGRLESTNATSRNNAINFSNTVTTVGSTGVLAAGGVSAATLTSTNTNLTINGTYEHKYTTVSGTLPTATWAATSNCNITGYTAASMVPAGTTQTFGNFTWNCTGQGTNNYNLVNTGTTTIQGTLSILSTGTSGSLRWGGTGSYILNTVNFAQSGGIFDLASGASGTASFNLSGTFNQTAGSLISSGTSTCNPTVHFNGTTNQSVTFATQPTGPITYRISNPAGITLTGPSANFTIGNGTLGGLRISTTAANPIAFGGTTTALSYNAANSTLTYDATTGNTTARATEFPATSGPANLTVAVGAGNVLSVPFSRTVRTTLTMTSGDIDISSNALTLGTAVATPGTLVRTAGNIRETTGSFTRWFGTTSLPNVAGSAAGLFPIALGVNNRNVSIYFSSTTALSSGGTITVAHNNGSGLSSITPFLDGTYSVDRLSNANWTITQSGLVATGTIGLQLNSANAFSSTTPANIRVTQVNGAAGTLVAGTASGTTFTAARTALTVAQLANTHYLGANNADIGLAFNSVASGNYNDPSVWDNGVPTCGTVLINSGHTITVNSNTNQASNLTINTGGTLVVASGDLTVGCINNNNTFNNNGILTVSGGTLNINGSLNHNPGATFNQSGGDINIDGNSGSAATSATTALLNILSPLGTVSGGRITIIDPPATSGATKSVSYSVTTTSLTWPTSHTLRLGDGVSTTAGGNANGYELDGYVGSGRHILGTVEVNGGSGTNRWTTSSVSTSNGTYITNLIINSGSEFRDGAAHTSNFYILGNITNNGTLTNQSATWKLAGWNSITNVEIANPNAQTIGGTGVFRNATSSHTATNTALLVNNINATGITLNVPLRTPTLTMTSGIINTTTTNILQLGVSTAGSLTITGGAGTYVNGPFERFFSASLTPSSVSTNILPVGKSGQYLPVTVNPQTNGGGSIYMRAEAFLGGSSVTGGAGVSNTSIPYWQVNVSPNSNVANFEGAYVRVADANLNNTSGLRSLLTSSSATGSYDGVFGGSVYASGSPNNVTSSGLIPLANYTEFFAYGDLTPCTAPADQANALNASNKTTTTFTGTISPASSSPTGYLVVRYASGGSATATPPINGTIYAVGASTLGTGSNVRAFLNAPTLSFSESGLSAGLNFEYLVYSFNNSGCAGPVYNTTSPTLYTHTACAGTIAAPTFTSITSPIINNITDNGFDINWMAPTTGTIPTNYLLDISTNNAFTSFVSGFENLSMGNGTSYSISGLNGGTTYFLRIKGEDAGCVSSTLAYNHMPTYTSSSVSTFSFNFDQNTTTTTSTIWPSGVVRYRPIGTTTDIAQGTTNPASAPNSVSLIGNANSTTPYTAQGCIVFPEVNNANAGTHRIRFKYAVSTANCILQFGYLSNPLDQTSFTQIGSDYTNSTTGVIQEVTLNMPTSLPANIRPAFRSLGTSSAAASAQIDDVFYEAAPTCTSPIGGTSTSSINQICNSGTVTLSNTGYGKDSLGFQYVWQSSTDNFATNIVNLGTPSATYAGYTSPTLTTGPMYYRLKNTCTSTSTDAYSNVLTVNILTPSLTSSTGDTVCGSGTAILTAVPGVGQSIDWYSASTGGTLLASSNSYTTPPLTATTNYFATSYFGSTITGGGKTIYAATSGNTSGAGLLFSANQGFTIDEVDIYNYSTSGASTVTFQLQDANNANAVIGSVVVNVANGSSTPTAQTVALGLVVPSAGNYRLMYTSGSLSLGRETSGVPFPISIGSWGSITNGTLGGYYYYFYNWKVSSKCNSSTRTQVTATYTNPPALSVDSSNFSICNGSTSTSVNVTSTLADFTSYSWSPASGVSGTTSATFNPTATTTYTLSATNSGTGCSNMLNRTVTVDALPSAITLSQGRTTAKCFSDLDSLEVSGGFSPITSLNSYTLVPRSSNYTPLSGATSIAFIDTDEEISSAIPIGFSFNFAGTNYSNVYVSTNGFVSFNASAVNTPMNNLSTSATTVRPLIAPLWDDLDITGGASYKLEGTSPNRIFIVEWNNVKWNWLASGAVVSFQAKLYEGSNNIEFLYRSDATAYNAGSTGGASVGLAGVSTGAGNFISLNSLGAAPTTSMTTETNNISSKPTTGQSYLFRAPIASSVWSPTAGLFTNRAMTTAYTGTSVNKVYSKPSATQYYYLTATNGACSLRDSIVDSVKNATNLITLASSTTTGAVEQCSDANGWTYYATAAKPDEWLFGIYKNGNNFTATVDINVDNTNKFTKSASSNGANQEHASYILSRYWNVNATGTVGSGVKVRFFIDPQDITDLLDERDNDYDVLKNNTNPSTLAVTGGFEWFKTTGTTYNPSNWTGNKHNGAIVKLTQDAVATLNGQTYVELSGITSFSGGSGGSSFGPSSNGLFNSGGTVGLPVTWKEVKATAKETGNLIQWSTSSEKNTKSFVVEYSYDAKEFFEASKDILAAGNSATERFYEFNHNEEYGELVYYRIKQIDLDGKMDYSKAVVVKRTSKLPEFNVSMYPIPLNVQELNIRIQTVQKTDISISINDLLGRNVYSETIIPAGYNTNHKMNLSHLPQGTYHVTINNGINKSVQVLVVGK